MPTITPSLWFDNDLEDAMAFYTSVFPNSSIEFVNRYTDAGPGTPGEVVSAGFVLDGARFNRHQRRPGVLVQRGGVVHHRMPRPGRGRLLLEHLVDGGQESSAAGSKTASG